MIGVAILDKDVNTDYEIATDKQNAEKDETGFTLQVINYTWCMLMWSWDSFGWSFLFALSQLVSSKYLIIKFTSLYWPRHIHTVIREFSLIKLFLIDVISKFEEKNGYIRQKHV